MSEQPNIVISNPDQWRGDVLGHLGNPAAQTPVLDQWVREDAVSFSHAFCQNPVCTPSRCSFMTGWYPHVRGHRTMFHMLQPNEPVLLKQLKDNGYHVWWGGKNDLVPAEDGFAHVCDVRHKTDPATPQTWSRAPADWRGAAEGDNFYSFYMGRLEPKADDARHYDTDWDVLAGAIDYLDKRPTDQPFCLFLALGYPHPPYGVEDPWYSQIERAALPPRTPPPQDWSQKPKILAGIAERQQMSGWTEARWDDLRATYYGMCARVDHQFGLLLQALKQAGVYDNTAIFFFSDHGDFTGDYGLVEKTQNTFEDCLTRVPLLVKPPASTPTQPRVSDALTELVDVPATIYDIAGIAPDYTHFGRSLLPLVTGATDQHRDAVFCEGGRRYGEQQAMELEAPDAHQLESLYFPRVGLQPREDGTHSKGTMCRTRHFKYVRRLYELDEFYDLRNDPQELRNLIDDPAYADIVRMLQLRLLTWYQETADVVPFKTNRRW